MGMASPLLGIFWAVSAVMGCNNFGDFCDLGEEASPAWPEDTVVVGSRDKRSVVTNWEKREMAAKVRWHH